MLSKPGEMPPGVALCVCTLQMEKIMVHTEDGPLWMFRCTNEMCSKRGELTTWYRYADSSTVAEG